MILTPIHFIFRGFECLCKRVFGQFFYPPYQALQRIPSIPKHCYLINVIQTFLQKKHLIFHVCPSLGWSFYRVGVTTDPTLVINHPHHINQHVYHIFENFVGLLKGKFICIFAIWSLRWYHLAPFQKVFPQQLFEWERLLTSDDIHPWFVSSL